MIIVNEWRIPNKLFVSAKLLRRWFTFLRLRVDGETEPSREPDTSASKSVLKSGLLFSMVKPEAYCNELKKKLVNCQYVLSIVECITFGGTGICCFTSLLCAWDGVLVELLFPPPSLCWI